MKKTFHILSTKVLDPALVKSLESYGLQVTQFDFIKKTIRVQKNIASLTLHPVIVLTSKTAVQAWIRISEELPQAVLQFPVYCLANATQTAARAHGLNIHGVAPDAGSLAELILKDPSIKSITFVCGNLRRDELPNKLKSKGIQVLEIEAYQTEYTPAKSIQPYHGVLFFSPSAVDSFLRLNSIGLTVAFCLGKTTAEHCRAVGFSEIQVADSLTPESLVQTVLNFYFNLPVHAQK